MKDCEPIEVLLKSVPCEDIEGKSLCIYLVKALHDSGLDSKMCRSETFDGVSNMSGKAKEGCSSVLSKNQKRKIVRLAS